MKYLLFATVMVFMAACANDQQAGNASNESGRATEKASSHESRLHLKDGKRWQLDSTLTTYLRTMEERINRFDGTTYNDYQVLAIDLKDDIDKMLSDCDMTGEAHDMLHLWLHPYMEAVNEYAKADNAKDASVRLQELKKAFAEFHRYFQ